MTKRDAALRKLSAAQFAAWDLHLYLDTHPWDTQALGAFEQATARAARLRTEYEDAYGPLTVSAAGAGWCKGPWPWDYQECDR